MSEFVGSDKKPPISCRKPWICLREMIPDGVQTVRLGDVASPHFCVFIAPSSACRRLFEQTWTDLH
jgi:hypothetical protein